MQGLKQGQGQGLDHKDQDKDKDLTHKDQDKDKDLTPKDQDKDKDLKNVLKESLRTRTRTRTNIPDAQAPCMYLYKLNKGVHPWRLMNT